MAVDQPLKGGNKKVYSVITNFSQGIDKRTADDVSSDSSFRELINFYNASEGALSKRPGVYESHLTDFVKVIVDESYSDKFQIIDNDFGETKATLLPRIQDFYNTILLGQKKSIEHQTISKTRTFQLDKIVGLKIIKNNKFLEALQDYETILNGGYSEVVGSSYIEFSCIVVAGGFTTEISNDVESNKCCGLYITRFRVVMDYDEGTGYSVKIEIDSVDPTTTASNNRRWLYYPEDYNFDVGGSIQYLKDVDEYIPLKPIDIADYNGFSYIATGKNYIIKIDQIPDNKQQKQAYPNESNIFEIIGGDDHENLYEPTAVELTQIGFNILWENPLEHYDTSGRVEKVKGVFYGMNMTVNGVTFEQPINKIPYNNAFFIHILFTGGTLPNKPQYRPDNGETDVEKNPYKDMPGDWVDSATKNKFNCTGLDSDQRFEVKITLGEDTFITYIDTTSANVNTTGYINEISKLVLSSTRLKVVNNQLVLYGKHGYVFFSEYDMFNYFPNYYYIYVASEAGEEQVTSINYFRSYYAVFTNKRIKKMVGNFGADNFGIYPLNDFIGCANGQTVRAIGNNLFFLSNDGVYKLKQGYLGEGTENVEKVDIVLGDELNLSNTVQAFVMNNNYVVVKNDGMSWIIYNADTNAFYRYELESLTGNVYDNGKLDTKITKRYLPFYSIFDANVYDTNGDFFIIPMYNYEYNSEYEIATLSKLSFMNFRFMDLNYIAENEKHRDGYGFISSLETHNMHMGYPTHTKKFKDVYIKLVNDGGYAVPLYVTIYVDDKKVVDPEKYTIEYNAYTNTYFYVLKTESNYGLSSGAVIGEFTLGHDFLGNKPIQQIKIRVGASGRSIRIKFRDGYNDLTDLEGTHRGLPIRERNIHDFSISSIGIVYKVKKVKEG